MKRFTRILFGIALTMFGIGCVLIVLGKSKMDTMIFTATPEYSGEVTVVAEEVDKIFIDVPYGYVMFETTEEDSVIYGTANVPERLITVKESAGEFSLVVEPEEEEFEIGEETVIYPAFFEISDENELPVYYIGVPENYAGRIHVLLPVGRLSLTGVQAGVLNAVVNVGEIVIEDVKLEMASMNCDVGRISAEGDFASLFSAEMAVGAIELQPEGTAKDYEVAATCEVGKLDYGNDHSGGFDLSKEQEAVNAGTIELQVQVGSIEVDFD